MTKPVAIVTRKWPEENEKRLKELFDVTLNESDKPFTSDELKSALQNCDVLMPTVTDKITADVLSVENRRANMIGNFGVGFNHKTLTQQKSKVSQFLIPKRSNDCTADIASLYYYGCQRVEGELRSDNWTGWRPTHLLELKLQKEIRCYRF